MTDKNFTPKQLNEGFVVAVRIDAKPGEGDAVARVLEQLKGPSNAEPGMKLFLPYRSPNDPDSFFVYELYWDEADWAAHNDSAHFKTLIQHLLPHVRHRERLPFVPYIPN